MNKDDREILLRINDYANQVLDGIDPQKVRISVQLEALKPVMEEIAKEKNCSVEDIFIKYMDLASEASVKEEKEFQDEMGPIFQEGNKNPF